GKVAVRVHRSGGVVVHGSVRGHGAVRGGGVVVIGGPGGPAGAARHAVGTAWCRGLTHRGGRGECQGGRQSENGLRHGGAPSRGCFIRRGSLAPPAATPMPFPPFR